MAKTNPIATPELLNAIRTDASEAYQANVPVATPFNLAEVGNPILNYQAMKNEFVDALVNKIAYPLMSRKMWENPLREMRTEPLPLGTDIEEIHVNPAKAEQYDGGETGMSDLLKLHTPDVASVYFRRNRQEKYPVTINNQQLRGAFLSWNNLENLIAYIVDSLYNGANIDDYKYTKGLVSDGIAGGGIILQNVVQPTNDATGKEFMKTLRALSVLFTFPSENYNSYAKLSGKPARTTWANMEDQVILIRADVAAAIGVEVLATLFNVQYGDYLAKQIIVDNFNDETTLAVLADRRAFIIKEQLREFANFFNAASLSWQYYLHCWDLFALSPLHNIVALTTAAVPEPEPDEPDEPDTPDEP